MLAKKEILVVSLSIISITQIVLGATDPKSVFIISKHSSPSQAQAFIINNKQVTYQAQVSIDTYNQGYGAVGNAVWSDKELMFVTYESSPMVVWASTKTFQKVGEFNTGISSCAGIAVDEDKEKIYIIRRDSEDLFVYSFDDSSNTLILEDQNDLETSSGYIDAWGLALDENNDLLYVSDETHTVHYYNTDNWDLEGSIDIEPGDVERHAVGVAIDGTHGYLYTGDWQDHNYLVRTLTNSPYTSIEVEITKAGYSSKEIIGIDVDEESGLVYCTTYHNDFRVYDYNLILQDVETQGIDGPAGVAVGGLYVPPFGVEKVDDVEGCASPRGQQIKYTISLDYQWDGYEDPNIIESIKIMDYHPREADFDFAQPDTGIYEYDDPNGGRYTWTQTDANSFGDTQYFELVVQSQNERLTPGDTIENNVEVIATVNEGQHVSRFTLETCVCYDTDFDTDGVVNYPDFAIFADAWLSDPCDDNWNSSCDLVVDNTIDIDDLADFAKEWLWIACDQMQGMPLMGDGGESMLLGETAMIDAAAQSSYTPPEPTAEEQIEQIELNLDWLEEVKDQVDEDIWLNLTGSLEEMLKDLEDSQ